MFQTGCGMLFSKYQKTVPNREGPGLYRTAEASMMRIVPYSHIPGIARWRHTPKHATRWYQSLFWPTLHFCASAVDPSEGHTPRK